MIRGKAPLPSETPLKAWHLGARRSALCRALRNDHGAMLGVRLAAGAPQGTYIAQVGEVIDDCWHVLRRDGGLVQIAHLVDLSLPGGSGQARLSQDHAGRMAEKAIVVDSV